MSELIFIKFDIYFRSPLGLKSTEGKTSNKVSDLIIMWSDTSFFLSNSKCI